MGHHEPLTLSFNDNLDLDFGFADDLLSQFDLKREGLHITNDSATVLNKDGNNNDEYNELTEDNDLVEPDNDKEIDKVDVNDNMDGLVKPAHSLNSNRLSTLTTTSFNAEEENDNDDNETQTVEVPLTSLPPPPPSNDSPISPPPIPSSTSTSSSSDLPLPPPPSSSAPPQLRAATLSARRRQPKHNLLRRSSTYLRQRFFAAEEIPPPLPKDSTTLPSFSPTHYPPKPLSYSPVDPPTDAQRSSLPIFSSWRRKSDPRRQSEPLISVKPKRSFFFFP